MFNAVSSSAVLGTSKIFNEVGIAMNVVLRLNQHWYYDQFYWLKYLFLRVSKILLQADILIFKGK